MSKNSSGEKLQQDVDGEKHVDTFRAFYRRSGSLALLVSRTSGTLLSMLRGYSMNKFVSAQGSSAREWLRPHLLRLFGCLSLALYNIHSRGLCHQDIKPGNIAYSASKSASGEINFFFVIVHIFWTIFKFCFHFSVIIFAE